MTSAASYGTALAAVHHQAFGEVALAAGPALVPLLLGAGLDGGLVVDLGCGSGLLARHLTDAGFDR